MARRWWRLRVRGSAMGRLVRDGGSTLRGDARGEEGRGSRGWLAGLGFGQGVVTGWDAGKGAVAKAQIQGNAGLTQVRTQISNFFLLRCMCARPL
ncbi:hypothetical protein HN873_062028 [Arachis hypogaea]